MSINAHHQNELTKAIREGYVIPERSGGYWDEAEKNHLTDLYYAGVGITEIALELHRQEQAVVQQLTNMGLFTSPAARRTRNPREPRCLCDQCRMINCGGCGHQIPGEAAYA